eukprot:3856609-Lingulodinium_polyedra.AAC.1
MLLPPHQRDAYASSQAKVYVDPAPRQTGGVLEFIGVAGRRGVRFRGGAVERGIAFSPGRHAGICPLLRIPRG